MSLLDSLRNVVRKQNVITYDFHGEPVCIQRLGAAPSFVLLKQWNTMPKDEDGKAADRGQMVEFMVELLAQTIVEADTLEKSLDSEEGRAFLRGIPVADLIAMGNFSAKHAGLHSQDDAKKNETTTTGCS